jgi:uncharacterized membrane protein YesL
LNEVETTPLRVPTVRAAFRAAFTDFYYQSLRLVPSNAAWGAGLLAVLASAFWLSPVLALVAAPLLCLPLVGVTRLAAQIVRGEDVVLSDAATAIRSLALPALATGMVVVLATVVLTANVVAGVSGGGPIGWAFATLAAWGLAALWIVGLAFWPILADPDRHAMPLAARVRLAVLVVLAYPARFASLAAGLALVTLVSAIAFAALLSVSVAFMALVASRVILPAADQLEARLAPAAATSDAIGQA